jgi:hypothetical protein
VSTEPGVRKPLVITVVSAAALAAVGVAAFAAGRGASPKQVKPVALAAPTSTTVPATTITARRKPIAAPVTTVQITVPPVTVPPVTVPPVTVPPVTVPTVTAPPVVCPTMGSGRQVNITLNVTGNNGDGWEARPKGTITNRGNASFIPTTLSISFLGASPPSTEPVILPVVPLAPGATMNWGPGYWPLGSSKPSGATYSLYGRWADPSFANCPV